MTGGAGGISFSRTAWKSDDQKWFRQNPKRSHRLRRMFAGEEQTFPPLWPSPPHHEWQVIVRQHRVGKRERRPFCRDTRETIPDVEPVVHALFDHGGGNVMPNDLLQLAIERDVLTRDH